MTLAGGGQVRVSAPVSELQLFDSTQYCLQVALLVFQHQSGQPLKHQGHVEHQHRVAGRHVTGLLSKAARKDKCDQKKKVKRHRKNSPPAPSKVPSAASVCTPEACRIWKVLSPGTAAPRCSDTCRISSGNSRTMEAKGPARSVEPYGSWKKKKARQHLTAEEKCDSYHLHSADVLLLLHVDVSQVQPDVADVRSGLSHLRKHVAGITVVAFVGQDGTCTGSSLV